MEFKCGTVWQERARVHGIDSKEKAASSCYYSPFFFCVPVWSMPHSISHPLWTSLSQWGLAHHPSQCQILCLILAASSSGRSQPRSASLFYPPVHISWRGRIFINVLGHLLYNIIAYLCVQLAGCLHGAIWGDERIWTLHGAQQKWNV